MLYPDILISIEEDLKLYIPDPGLIKEVYEQRLSEYPDTPFPFWAQIWPSAKALVSFLKEEPKWIENKTVLELGAGIGLPSFSIANHAKEIIISDHSADAVMLMNKNIHHLSLQHAKAMCIDWNHFPDDLHADVVLLSDVNYDPHQFISLQTLINKLINKGTTIILSTPQRITIKPFAEFIAPFIKHSVLMNIQHMDQLIDIRVVVLAA